MILLYLLGLFAVGQGLFQIALIITGVKNNFKDQLVLAAFIGILSLSILEYAMVWSGQISSIPHFIGFSALFQFLFCPLIYFFFKLSKVQKIERVYLHLIPMGLAFIILFDFISSSASYKLSNFSDVYAYKIMVAGIVIPILLLFFLQCAYYAYKILPMRSEILEPVSLILFRFFLLYVTVHLFHTSLISFFPTFIPYFGIGILLLSVGTIYAISIYAYKRGIAKEKGQLKKYAHSKLDKEKSIEIISRLDTYVNQDHYYTNSNIKLGQLASEISVPAQQLSQAINQELGCSFRDYINSKRIAFAEGLIQDNIADKISIKEISYSAGFNNKSTFYNAFKKKHGQSPSEFVHRIKSQVAVR